MFHAIGTKDPRFGPQNHHEPELSSVRQVILINLKAKKRTTSG